MSTIVNASNVFSKRVLHKFLIILSQFFDPWRNYFPEFFDFCVEDFNCIVRTSEPFLLLFLPSVPLDPGVFRELVGYVLDFRMPLKILIVVLWLSFLC